MANATKCAAPESNRGRDEWMTVIEMQEYMRRAETRRTTSSGRERSTHTGSGGSSWCRGRQWTPTYSRGAEGDDGGDRPGSRAREGDISPWRIVTDLDALSCLTASAAHWWAPKWMGAGRNVCSHCDQG